MLSAKEIKAFLEIGQTMGLAGEELRKYVESEKAAALKIEKAKVATAAEERAAAQQLELEKRACDQQLTAWEWTMGAEVPCSCLISFTNVLLH